MEKSSTLNTSTGRYNSPYASTGQYPPMKGDDSLYTPMERSFALNPTIDRYNTSCTPKEEYCMPTDGYNTAYAPPQGYTSYVPSDRYLPFSHQLGYLTTQLISDQENEIQRSKEWGHLEARSQSSPVHQIDNQLTIPEMNKFVAVALDELRIQSSRIFELKALLDDSEARTRSLEEVLTWLKNEIERERESEGGCDDEREGCSENPEMRRCKSVGP